MAMNREQKRMLQRQGQLGPDGEPARPARQQPAPRTREGRVGPAEYVREVRGELRKVAWPTRAEVVRYSTIVFFTIVVLTALIFVLDYAVAKGVLFLFDQ